jgi:O-acetylhomoserine (thiol)-lyase
MERHCENAMKVARHLESHADVSWVRYPGLPSDPQYDKAQKYLKSTGKFVDVIDITVPC